MKVFRNFCSGIVFLFSFSSLANQEITFVGDYTYYTDAESLEYLGDVVCFNPNDETAKLVIRKQKSNRSVWFCFAPNIEARKSLKVPPKKQGHCGYSGTASIIVSNYTDTGGYEPDTAKLNKVLSLGKVKEILCQ
ncbi:hypothetical protein [Psychromonas aquimarina]|uniref:hypothetical protein n=1 Tax=Psychromonas aquimarina TaxID=444919 RepID=UPI0006844A19|nr:hypothetical protein [Psychromonas aquimarina]